MSHHKSRRHAPPQLNLAAGELFGNDAGEDERPEILSSYFVDQPAFSPFLDPDEMLRIGMSRKGMGKSALLSKLAYSLPRSTEGVKHVVIQTTGADLAGLGTFPEPDFALLQNYWKQILCARINLELGKRIGVAFGDTRMALVENAEISGFRGKNLVGSLIARLSSDKIPLKVTARKAENHLELLKRAADEFADSCVWLLVDDIDSTYVNSPELKARISTFFSACRSLVRDVQGLRIRASVRTDVWSVLRDNEDLDKCQQYITEIAWSKPELRRMLAKKVLSYIQRNYPAGTPGYDWDLDSREEELLELVFMHRLRWGQTYVPPFQPIGILSAGRPRWVAQLCRMAGEEAFKKHKKRIGIQDVNTVMKPFGRYRLNDVYREHSHQFSDLQRLIETFAHGKRRYSTRELNDKLATDYIFRVGIPNIPTIDNYPYKTPRQFSHFLFKIGFVAGRISFNEFVTYQDRPELLTNTTNLDDGMDWEIYPSYRQVLRIS
ncbi:MAG: hypothetical protein HN849_02485 [Victivallales bacterium]|nr:hypothetical protein [Victivallales bacterium]